MVDEQFRIHSKKLIKKLLPVIQRTTRHIAHGKQTVLFQLSGISSAYAPEVRQRPVRPQHFPVADFIQLCDAHAVFIGCDALSYNIHGDLAQVQIGSDPSGGCDAGFLKHFSDHHGGKFLRRHSAGFQIRRRIHEHLVNGVHMDILRRHMPQVNLVDARAVVHIQRHARRRSEKIHLPVRMRFQFFRQPGLSGKTASGCKPAPPCIDFIHFLNRFKQSGASRHTQRLQWRRYRQADCLFRTGGISHHQMRFQRIQPALHAFHRRIKGFQVDGNIAFLHPQFSLHNMRTYVRIILISASSAEILFSSFFFSNQFSQNGD